MINILVLSIFTLPIIGLLHANLTIIFNQTEKAPKFLTKFKHEILFSLFFKSLKSFNISLCYFLMFKSLKHHYNYSNEMVPCWF